MSRLCIFFFVSVLILFATDAPDRYVLGPGDAISVQVVGLSEFGTHPYPVDADGTVGLPLVGRIRAEGLTLPEFEEQLVTDLKKQVLQPRVVTSLAERRGAPVTVMGAVNNPGTQQVQTRKTLFDVLAGAGGVKTDAGGEVTITRLRSEGPLSLPGAYEDPATGRLTAAVSLHELLNQSNPAANIVVRPHDEISVPRAQVIYVIGDVKKAGGFTLSQGGSLSTLEALSLAEGFAPNAAPKSARILRKQGAGREQIPVNLNKVLAGKVKDVQLSAGDILYIPDNTSRRVTTRTLEAALTTISGVIIWRGF
jgi:polysaccharide biosynthesis/export protein